MTTSAMKARDELDKLVKFNKGKRGQYRWGYIVKMAHGYMVRLSKNKPTAKKSKIMQIKKIGW